MSATPSNQPNIHDRNQSIRRGSSRNEVHKHSYPSLYDSDSGCVGDSGGRGRSRGDDPPLEFYDEPYLPPTSCSKPSPIRSLRYLLAPEPDFVYRSYSQPCNESNYTGARPRSNNNATYPEHDLESEQPYLPPGYEPRPVSLSRFYHYRSNDDDAQQSAVDQNVVDQNMSELNTVDQDIHDTVSIQPPPPTSPTIDPRSSSSSNESHATQSPDQSPEQPQEPSDPSSSSSTGSSSEAQEPRSRRWMETDKYLRSQAGISAGTPVDLWAVPDPPPGQKPQQHLPLLVKLAIHGSGRGKLTLQEIYQAMEDRFEWFRARSDHPWRNSIRHNLSLNQVFRSAERPITEPGKGRYWELDVSQGEGYKRQRRRRKKNAAPYHSKRDLPGGVGNRRMNMDMSDEDTGHTEEDSPPARRDLPRRARNTSMNVDISDGDLDLSDEEDEYTPAASTSKTTRRTGVGSKRGRPTPYPRSTISTTTASTSGTGRSNRATMDDNSSPSSSVASGSGSGSTSRSGREMAPSPSSSSRGYGPTSITAAAIPRFGQSSLPRPPWAVPRIRNPVLLGGVQVDGDGGTSGSGTVATGVPATSETFSTSDSNSGTPPAVQ